MNCDTFSVFTFPPPLSISSAKRLLVLLLLVAGNVLAADAVMEYRYWDWGRTPRRDDYQAKVLELALDKTRAEYGPYRIVRVVESLSTFRVRSEVAEGRRVNVHVGPWRELDKENPLDRNIAIDIPIMSGLLGYRSLIIRREDLPRFKAITSADQLKKLVAGQGRNWVEVPMYKRNGYRVDDSGNLKSLIPMLANKRIDYLPMSITEVSSALAQYPEYARQLTVAPGILIKYPLPAIFYVSPKEPELAARLRRGLTIADKDGSLDALLLRSFKDEIQASSTETTRLFTMSNPSIPKRLIRPLPSAAPCRKPGAAHGSAGAVAALPPCP
ncbi:MAG: hypothetical protein ABIT83_12375 [Massilia sp.]